MFFEEVKRSAASHDEKKHAAGRQVRVPIARFFRQADAL
jgi:hypothetical protein